MKHRVHGLLKRGFVTVRWRTSGGNTFTKKNVTRPDRLSLSIPRSEMPAGRACKCSEGFHNALSDGRSMNCVPCAKGETSNGAACVSCKPGEYKNVEGSSRPIVSPGRFNNRPGATSIAECILCPKGQTMNGTRNASACVLCDPGTYKDVEGGSRCQYVLQARSAIKEASPPLIACTATGEYLDNRDRNNLTAGGVHLAHLEVHEDPDASWSNLGPLFGCGRFLRKTTVWWSCLPPVSSRRPASVKQPALEHMGYFGQGATISRCRHRRHCRSPQKLPNITNNGSLSSLQQRRFSCNEDHGYRDGSRLCQACRDGFARSSSSECTFSCRESFRICFTSAHFS